MKNRIALASASITILGFALAQAGWADEANAPGESAPKAAVDHPTPHPGPDWDRRGDRIDDRLDRRGDRIDRRLDRRADRLRARGHFRLAYRLDRRGDRIADRLDRIGNRIDRRLDRRYHRRHHHHRHHRHHHRPHARHAP